MLKAKLKSWCNTLYSDSPATKKKESFSLILKGMFVMFVCAALNPFKELNHSQGNENEFKYIWLQYKELYHQLPLMTYWIQFSNHKKWQKRCVV